MNNDWTKMDFDRHRRKIKEFLRSKSTKYEFNILITTVISLDNMRLLKLEQSYKSHWDADWWNNMKLKQGN